MSDTAEAVERAIARLDPIIHNDHWTTPGEHGEGGIKAALRLELTAAYKQGRLSAIQRAPLSIDCDGCGQVVVIPEHGDVGCGCAGTRWSLTRSKSPEAKEIPA
jgi:hypothetical protein